MERQLDILPLKEFEQLDKEQQIKKLRDWIVRYSVGDIRKAWELKYPTEYYQVLRRLGIYDDVVRKSNKFMRDFMLSESDRPILYEPKQPLGRTFPSQFQEALKYDLQGLMTGQELGERLGGMAHLIRASRKHFRVSIQIEEWQPKSDREEAAAAGEESGEA
ncbi:hypothetical protein ACFQWB_00635 [Paenibacillus thermoaerophilus]|uniref:Uncharacterized protein n=1 Tax=Paenibacillus thermoaerophilus TaxID=1215385 RepID=A0ABW2UZE1_9BACL|nr:hypothetical protein [Paenibacillus thermoaerophilus]TMV17321.1 hypothetical protein FE781_07465 [Paenibacillus thermoaerophilus]